MVTGTDTKLVFLNNYNNNITDEINFESIHDEV